MIKNSQNTTPVNFAFFGSSRFSVIVLDELYKLGFIPSLIVTTPDKPQGRKLTMTANVVKTWAIEKNISVFDPEKIDANIIESLKEKPCDVFVVASYGKILPEALINIPPHKTLNIHPSLLPKYRGASPLQSVMLDDAKDTGISIMRIDEKMDHGPIIAKKEIRLTDYFLDWPIYEDFEEFMAREGAKLLVKVISDWVMGKIKAQEQNHAEATYTKKMSKDDGQIYLTPDELKDSLKIPEAKSYEVFRKIQAYHEWPGGYFFIEHAGKKIRVKITSASYDNQKLIIEKVIPEGSKEMSYKDFQSGYSVI